MALQVRELNKTQTIMRDNQSYFYGPECDLDVEGLATFGLEHGDMREVRDENDLYLWALQIKDILEGRPVRDTLIMSV